MGKIFSLFTSEADVESNKKIKKNSVVGTETSKQNTISQISSGWDNILWTLTLDCGPSRFYSLIASCLPLSLYE